MMKVRNMVRVGAAIAASVIMVGLGSGSSLTASSTLSQPPTVQTQTENVNPAGGFWSTTPPTPSGKTPANAVKISIPRILPAYYNDLGCNGLKEGGQFSPSWYCRASNYNQWLGQVVVVRVGYFNKADPGAEGVGYYGWNKFYWKHEVNLQTVLNAIGQSTVNKGDAEKLETMNDYYYENGEYIEDLRTIVDMTNDRPQKENSIVIPSGQGDIGVLTAYCREPNGTRQYECPNWVNTTLGGSGWTGEGE
jgi:hypothetical protein